jgi:hypothetical protein
MLLNLKSAGMQLITGPGHLYFVFVLMQFYLVAGAITGAHLPAVRAWVWRHRWPVPGAAARPQPAGERWPDLTSPSALPPCFLRRLTGQLKALSQLQVASPGLAQP